jgi:hypothetical protein
MVGDCLFEKEDNGDMDDKLEKVLQKRKTLFTKNILCALIRYLTQISFIRNEITE